MQGLLWCAAVLVALAATRAWAAEAEDLGVLGAGGGERLHAYLLDECRRCFDARREAVAALDDPAKIAARQERLRAAWVAALGPLPERTPLKARVTGTIDRPAYRIEKVLYESRPDHHVTGNLYVPKTGEPPYPAVLVPCGHSGNGKAYESYQAVSALAATYGFVALCYDPIGQGERIQTFDAAGKPAAEGTTEHTLTDVGARLVGLCVANYRVWDGIRSIDYLAGRPEVDPKRIGCTGNSGGGTMTCYLMTADDRIGPAAVSCYVTSLERLFATIGPQDGEQNIPGQVALGVEHADYLTMRLPKPTLILAAAKDFFDSDGTWTTFREAKRLASLLGHTERVDLLEAPGEHGYAKPQREAALRWMRRWLQGVDDSAAAEPPLTLCTDAELQVTETGHVVPELKGRTVWDLNLERARGLAAAREAFWRDRPKDECLAEVRRLAGVRPAAGMPGVRSVGTVEREGCRIEKLVIERPGEVPVPALLLAPAERKGKLPAVLYVDGRGKARDAAPGGPVEAIVRAGRIVLSIDARGWGETAPKKPDAYWHEEYPFAYLAFHLGRPLLGQRVEDALAALEVLAARPEVDPGAIGIVGVERGGPVALHATALDARLRDVTIEGAIESWMDVVATPLGQGQLSQVVPGALARYDLPDLVRAIAPRPVAVRNPFDPTGKPKAAPPEAPGKDAER